MPIAKGAVGATPYQWLPGKNAPTVGSPQAEAPGQRSEPVGMANSSDAALEDFDESAYLAAFPDVVESIKAGHFHSALAHYEAHGHQEGRLTDADYEALVRAGTAGFPAASVDEIYGCPDGKCLVFGWIGDDEQNPVSKLVLRSVPGLRGSTAEIYRYRREDITQHLGRPEPLAFWAVVTIERTENNSAPAEVTLSIGAQRKTFTCQIRPVDEKRFIELTLDHLAKTQTRYSPEQALPHLDVETFRRLDAGLGSALIGLNLKMSTQIASGAQTIQIGVPPVRPEASLIVCLYGKPEWLRIQCALFSKCRGIENYEFIYVSNSPEMAQTLIKDATIANRIYGMPIKLILLPGNAGFGVANNVAADAARSGRLLIVNPDIFPMDPDWPRKHDRIVNGLPPEQVALFGAPLYYDDGSLMHGGIYCEVDVELAFRNQQATRCELIRVEHYGKGAPPNTRTFLGSRPVPAVSGAFMSIEREWFESLGGFAPEYMFGQFEDVDLCFKSFVAGKPVWLHDLPFVHFEGKGSTHGPVQISGRMVNRWHFTNVWGELVKTSFNGPVSEALSTPRAADAHRAHGRAE
jgi:GT2 family glycosyltransferase